MATAARPSSDVDLFADEILAEPFDAYAALRATGPAVFLSQYGVWALPRYAEVRAALFDWQTFSSAQGISLNARSVNTTRGIIVSTDPPEHSRLRSVLSERLAPRAIRNLQADLEARADELVASVVAKGSFDAVADLARTFPVSVVLDLVGLPQDSRDRVLDWADAAFSAGGPPGPRTDAAIPLLEDQFAYLAAMSADELSTGSWGRAIYDAAAEGRIDARSCVPLMSAFVTAGLDTTINALSNAVWYFAQYPDQWEEVRADPSLIPSAFNEILRIDSPIQWFARVTTADVTLEDVTIPAGDRVLMLYASANRDERKWNSPGTFDVRRNPVDQVAFGYGVHACAGQGLARLEAHAILSSLARRVATFTVGKPVRRLNNRVRGLGSLPTTVSPAVS